MDFFTKSIKQGIKPNNELSEYLFKQMIMIVHTLHTVCGMAHLDIKPDNFVLTHDFKLALIDFCHSDHIDTTQRITTGTSLYQPPELRFFVEKGLESKLNYQAKAADIWSLGINLFIAMGYRPPYQSL
jgi:serine/threonine protein kinase